MGPELARPTRAENRWSPRLWLASGTDRWGRRLAGPHASEGTRDGHAAQREGPRVALQKTWEPFCKTPWGIDRWGYEGPRVDATKREGGGKCKTTTRALFFFLFAASDREARWGIDPVPSGALAGRLPLRRLRAGVGKGGVGSAKLMRAAVTRQHRRSRRAPRVLVRWRCAHRKRGLGGRLSGRQGCSPRVCRCRWFGQGCA